MMEKYFTQPATALSGTLRVASDKSLSHRALIFSALALGETKIHNLLLGEDVLRTLTILNQLGVKTSHTADTLMSGDTLVVQGVGLQGFKKPQDILYCGNSGTTLRLLLGLMAAQPFSSKLTGDASLNKRPMERVMEPLRKMGAAFLIEETQTGCVIIVNPQGERALQGIHYKSPVASAQIKTALLLAGLYVDGETTIEEPVVSRNHTELMLSNMGAAIETKDCTIKLLPLQGKALQPSPGGQIDVPADISSAAFFIVAALIVPGSKITLTHVNLNPTRTGVIDVLKKMGGKISIKNEQILSGEKVGDLEVEASPLKGTEISGSIIPRLIDEIPILAMAAACAQGQTIIKDARELRVKETDRIKAICTELTKMGVAMEEKDDGFVIQGHEFVEKRFTLHTSRFTSYGDHRMAMMECVAGLLLDSPCEIDDVACVRTSFPAFFEMMQSVIIEK